jgi:hypothetical protein
MVQPLDGDTARAEAAGRHLLAEGDHHEVRPPGRIPVDRTGRRLQSARPVLRARRYSRDCQFNEGHELGRIPADEILQTRVETRIASRTNHSSQLPAVERRDWTTESVGRRFDRFRHRQHGGRGLALLAAKVASLAMGAAQAVGSTAAVVLFRLHLLYEQQ